MGLLDIRWEAFEYMNENKTKRFETLCRRLFRAHFCRQQEILHANHNTQGIEVLPVLAPEPGEGGAGTRISFQAKYTSSTNSAYSKFEESARQTVNHFAGKLDLVYLFSNQTLTNTSKRFRSIKEIFSESHINIKPISNEELLDLISKYQDIARDFFPEQTEKYESFSGAESTIDTGVNRQEREKAFRHESNTPIINVYKDKMNWGGMFKNKLYRQQTFIIKNSGIEMEVCGAENLYANFLKSNLLITGEAGFGKTAALERIYLQNALDDHEPVYYLPAYVFHTERKITRLQETIRNAIINGEKVRGLLLIDGLEEAFIGNRGGASALIRMLGDSGSFFWVACRSGFYETFDTEDMGFFDSVAYVKPWNIEDFKEFVLDYETYLQKPGLAARTELLITRSVMETTSIFRPLYALLFLFLALEDMDSGNKDSLLVIRNEYDLIEQFVKLWFTREGKRDKRVYNLEDYLPVLRSLALDVYKSVNPELPVDDSVISDFLVLSANKSKPYVERFCHREFCIYFIAERIIDGMLKGDMDLIQCFSPLYYDDVTNLCKVHLRTCTHTEIQTMHDNMLMLYKQTYELEKNYLISSARNAIKEFDDLQILSLRDEIIYYITRLPGAEKRCREFIDYAVQNINGDVMISMGLAYGTARIMTHPHTLAFARRLYPGTHEELRNRSWGLAFFADIVCENGYTYEDDGKSEWTNVRRNILINLATNGPEYYRSRVLYLPLLYCYYASKDFEDCNSWEDLDAIEKCDIENFDYSDEEREFLAEQKKKLVESYKEHLIGILTFKQER